MDCVESDASQQREDSPDVDVPDSTSEKSVECVQAYYTEEFE